MNSPWIKTKPLGLAAQALALKQFYPGASVSCNRGTLTWEGTISARKTSLEYYMRLFYRLESRPKVYVLHPDLSEMSGGRAIPHLFSQKEQSLCLHFKRVWKTDMVLAKTIVPWSVLWTDYFEGWLFTDEWAGEEILHSGNK